MLVKAARMLWRLSGKEVKAKPTSAVSNHVIVHMMMEHLFHTSLKRRIISHGCCGGHPRLDRSLQQTGKNLENSKRK